MSVFPTKPITLLLFAKTINLPAAPRSFSELQSMLRETFGIPNPVVQYKDEEGDMITVSTQPEFEDALILGGDPVVNLTVVSIESLRDKKLFAFNGLREKAVALENFQSILDIPLTVSRISEADQRPSPHEAEEESPNQSSKMPLPNAVLLKGGLEADSEMPKLIGDLSEVSSASEREDSRIMSEEFVQPKAIPSLTETVYYDCFEDELERDTVGGQLGR